MKKFYLFFLFIFPGLVSQSQKINDDARFSFRAGFGYNLPVATGVLTTNLDNGTTKGIYGSWGKGFIPSLDFSVRTCKDFREVLGFGSLFGPVIKSSFLSGTGNSSTDRTTKSNLMIPVLITMGERYDIHLWQDDDHESQMCSHFIPYMGFGLGVALGTTVKNSVHSIQTTGNNSVTTEIKSTTTFKPALDLYGEMGAKYMFSERLSVFLDARLSSMSLMPSKQKITSEIVNGQDVTSRLSISQKETDFKKTVSSVTSSQDEPVQQLAEKFPASGLSVNCGIAWNFGFGGKVLLGGPGMPPGGPKPGGKGANKEKAKQAAAAELTAEEACKNCPAPVLKLISNNDDKDFPAANTKISKEGPYGKTELLKVEILTDHATCDSCGAVNKGCCCCRLDTLKIKLTFQITFNTAAIEKGVWLNTNKESDMYEHTVKGKDLPEHTQVNGKQIDLKPEEWKKVDAKSVEIHERQHCSDMKDEARKFLENEFKKLKSFQCCTDDEKRLCAETVKKLCKGWKSSLEGNLKGKMNDISNEENADYGKGNFEKHARETQAEELNKRE